MLQTGNVEGDFLQCLIAALLVQKIAVDAGALQLVS